MYETSDRLDYAYDEELGINVFRFNEGSRAVIDEWLAIMDKIYGNTANPDRPRLMILDMSKATAPLRYMRQEVLKWKAEHPRGEGYIAVVYEDSVFMSMLKMFIDMWNVKDPIRFFKLTDYEDARKWLAEMIQEWKENQEHFSE